jgi:hypothetical protein
MPPDQMGHMLRNQEKDKKKTTPFVKEQKGCVCIGVAREGPKGSRSQDLTPKSKPKLLGEKGPKRRSKNLESHLEGKPDKPNNAFDVEP